LENIQIFKEKKSLFLDSEPKGEWTVFKGTIFTVETWEKNKFVKVGEITVLVEEVQKALENTKRMHKGMSKKIATEKAYKQFDLKNKHVAITHKKYLWCKKCLEEKK
jgi:16S rRNA C1402 (ribose-2'-O) methylase RsmI